MSVAEREFLGSRFSFGFSPDPSTQQSLRRFTSLIGGRILGAIAVAIVLVIPFILFGLATQSTNVLSQVPLSNILGQTWNTDQNQFGLVLFAVGSFAVTGLTLVITLPLALASALYLTEYVRPKHLNYIRPLIDLLAGVPSVVYGMWGVLVIIPVVRALAIAVKADQTTGYGLLSTSLVLALMSMPYIISMMMEVLQAVPRGTREAALAMGATKWEVIRDVLLRRSMGGLIAAAGMGSVRAFGETMVVLMLCGNTAQVPGSIFASVYPIPALIANKHGDLMSVPLYESAMMLAALVLLVVVLFFNVGSRQLIRRVSQHG
jgi:phosphate transport system permease protein